MIIIEPRRFWKETIEKERGGARREYSITEESGRYSEKEQWEKLRTIGMVHKTLKRDTGIEEEYRYSYPDLSLFSVDR